MTTILSCTDGSAYAPSVYDHTAWAALRMDAQVHVLHTLDPQRESASLSDLSGSLRPDALDALMAELVALDEAKGRVALLKGRAILQEAERHLRSAGVAEIKSEQRHGSLVDTLAEFEPGSELVVLGKRGKSADHAASHLGGNLQRIIRSSHHPVLVASRKFVPLERFLLAFDGSPSARKAVDYAVNEPLLKGLECLLLRARRGASIPAFDEARRDLQGAGYNVTATEIEGEPEEVIADAINAGGIQLLAMGAFGHSRIRQLIVGSTTTTMVRTCHVPVLMFR